MRTVFVAASILTLALQLFAADKLNERDERVNRIVKAGGKFTFDNRKKERPPIAIRWDGVPTKEIRDDIAALGTVQSVHAEAAGLIDKDLPSLVELPHLTKLYISGTFHNEGLRHLLQAVELEHLKIESSRITNDCLSTIGQLPNLRSLAFGECPQIDDGGLKLLRPARELRAMDLSGLKVDGSGFADLKPLPRLEQLWLKGRQVTDAALQPLRTLGLKSLRFERTSITDGGLRHLEEIDGLRYLELADSGTVTREGLATLSRKRPRLKIQN